MTASRRELTNSGGFFDVPAQREELAKIETQASAPDFWNNQEAAQKLLQVRSQLEKKIERQEHFVSQIDDAGVLFEFAEEDPASMGELHSLIERLDHEVSQAETEMLLAVITIIAMPSAQYIPAPAVQSRRIGLRCCCECI